jgi:hypothetical protein
VNVTLNPGTGIITVAIENNVANPTSVIQCVSGFGFVLSTGQTSGSFNSVNPFVATVGTIADGGAVSNVGPATTTHWQLQNGVSFANFPGGTGLMLNDLVGGQPINTIIGDGPYTNANSSITGDTHEPIWFGGATPVTFSLYVPGITSGTTLTYAQCNFGTEGAAVVPVPPAVLLLGSGLLGLGFLGWRRKKV